MLNFVDRLLSIISEKENGKHTVFAKKAGIQAGTFQNYIKGRKPSFDAMLNICKTYGVNLNWLVAGIGSKYIDNDDHLSLDPDPEIAELMEGARRVLKSGNTVAFDALERNIHYFDYAIKQEKRMAEMEERLGALEGKKESETSLGEQSSDKKVA